MLHRSFPALAALFLLAFASPAVAAPPERAYDLTVTDIDGESLPLARFAGKALLVVNTASMCGYTPQFEQLQALWERYRARGLVVIGVPSDDFNQEYADAAEVKRFCAVNFAVDFPMTAISHVRGADAHPLFAFAERGLGDAAVPRWNFHKVLFDAQGQPVEAFATGVRPDDARVVEAIEGALPGPGA